MRTLHLFETLTPNHGGPVTYWDSVRAAVEGGKIEAVAATPGGNGPGVVFCGGGGVSGIIGFGRWLSREISSFDVVHVHEIFSWPLFLGAPLAKSAGVPLVVSSHGNLYPWSLTQKAWKKRPYMALYLRQRLREAAAIVATCDREADVLRRLDPEIRIAIVPPGLTDWPEPREEARNRDETLRLVFLNRIAHQKGLPTLLRSLGILRDRGCRVALDLVGDGDPELRRELETLCESLGITDRVHWRGFLGGRERFDVLRRSDLFVLSSNMENFSFATAEALACGLPAVVSDQVALAAEILQYDCGRVTPVGQEEAFANAVAEYAERPEQLREHSQRALVCARERFGLDAMNRALERTYAAAASIGSDEKN